MGAGMTAPVYERTKPGVPRCDRLRLPPILVLSLAVLGLMLAVPNVALAQEGPTEAATEVDTESELRAAWADPLETSIRLTEDIYLR